ncbi:hypothetical protein NUM3379_34840 [Kineococcus sp. NUM-3379]
MSPPVLLLAEVAGEVEEAGLTPHRALLALVPETFTSAPSEPGTSGHGWSCSSIGTSTSALEPVDLIGRTGDNTHRVALRGLLAHRQIR